MAAHRAYRGAACGKGRTAQIILPNAYAGLQIRLKRAEHVRHHTVDVEISIEHPNDGRDMSRAC
jgi:hypothetical protein